MVFVLFAFWLFLSLGDGAMDIIPGNYVCPLRGHLLGFECLFDSAQLGVFLLIV